MNFNDVPGWFMPIDQAAFTWILRHQNQTEPEGALVELGVFKGKSAILMGNFLRPGEVFTACDLFDDIVTSDAADANEKRFFKTQSLTQDEFERNYLAFHAELPRVVRGPTSTVTRFVAPKTARFVHIDAGHTYDLVREDTASARAMLRDNGVVVFDDYRKTNTMGVAAVVWEAILNEGLKPIQALRHLGRSGALAGGGQGQCRCGRMVPGWRSGDDPRHADAASAPQGVGLR